MAKNMKIKLVKSLNGRLEKQHCHRYIPWACVRSVTSPFSPTTPQTRGKIAKIGYLLQVTEEN